jgi:hypothetical protein
LTGDVDKNGACGPIIGIGGFASDEDTNAANAGVGGGGAGKVSVHDISITRTPCEDDLSVWWVDVRNPYANPFWLQDLGNGTCATHVGGIQVALQDGSVRFIRGGVSVAVGDVDTGIQVDVDCDNNGIFDYFQEPLPDCLMGTLTTLPNPGEDRSEDPAWWEQVLNLTCGGSDWIIMLDTDANGNEVVTDAQCTDDLE